MEKKMTDAEKQKFLSEHQEFLDGLIHVARDHYPEFMEERRVIAERFNELTGLSSSVMDRIEVMTLVMEVKDLRRTVEQMKALLMQAAENGNRMVEKLAQLDIANVPLRAEQEKKAGSN